jgi:hypothetical protein
VSGGTAAKQSTPLFLRIVVRTRFRRPLHEMREERDMIKPKLHHVTFKTSRLDDMIAWYETVIGTKVQFKDKTAAWMTNDEANHRIAFLAVPGLSDDEQKSKHNGMQREQNFSSGLCGSDDRRAGATSAYSPAFHSRILNPSFAATPNFFKFVHGCVSFLAARIPEAAVAGRPPRP